MGSERTKLSPSQVEVVQQVARAICENNCDPGFDQPHCDWDDCLRDAKIAVDIVWPLARVEGRREAAEAIKARQTIVDYISYDLAVEVARGAQQPDEKERTDGQ